MAGNVKPIPDGYHTLTPYLTVPGVSKLIDFLKQAFDAEEIERFGRPDGTVHHAEIRIGDSVVMMGEAGGEWTSKPGQLYLYVKDVDTTYRRAIQAGATSMGEPTDKFYGDRSGGVQDPSGNIWWIATHVEDVSKGELQKRATAMATQHA